jgi:hypothetical protein
MKIAGRFLLVSVLVLILGIPAFAAEDPKKELQDAVDYGVKPLRQKERQVWLNLRSTVLQMETICMSPT